jgi:hypothetical protein
MLGTDETGIVTLANAVVPVEPVAVKPMSVELVVTLDMVASLLTEQPVPHPVWNVTLNVTTAEWTREPLVPVTVTFVIWAEENMHESVAVPEPVTLVGLTVHATLSVVKLTTPVNPFTDVTAIVEDPAEPALTSTLIGLAVKPKSGTTTAITVILPELPVLPLCVVSPP